MAKSWLRRLFAASERPTRASTIRLGVHELEERITPYNVFNRYTVTATNPGPLQRGDATTVTWGFVPDGTLVSGVGSTLIARLDAAYGAGPGGSNLTLRPWFTIFNNAFTRLSQISGITYVYEPRDDGVNHGSAPGVLGVRADQRIAGIPVDGPFGTLGYNAFPNNGDMVIDIAELQFGGSFISNPSNNHRVFRNMLMHESGHGLGLDHQMPNDGRVLMNPSVTTAFDGPQFDDILGFQRLYGDAWEKNGGNDTLATATPLGLPLGNGTVQFGQDGDVTAMLIDPTRTNFMSIDGSSDADVFSFNVLGGTNVTITAAPVGFTYLSGAQGGPPPTNFDALRQSDLRLELLDASGAVVASSNSGGLGVAETINYTVSVVSGGTYYVRVRGTQDAAQMYKLTATTNVITLPVAITRSATQPTPTNSTPIRFDVAFGSPVTGFDASDIQFNAGTLTSGLFAAVLPNGAGGDRYFVDVFGANGIGTVGITIPAGAATSVSFGITSLAATTPASQLVSFDNTAPTAVLSPSSLGLTSSASTPITLTFSKPVNTLAAGAFQLTNATITNFTQVSATSYTLNLRPTVDGAFSAILPAGATADTLGNLSTAASVTGTYDGTAPQVGITRLSPAATRTGPVIFLVQFSEPIVSGSFTASDVLFTGSTVGGTLSATVVPEPGVFNGFRVMVSGMAGSGTVTIRIPAGAVTDPAGNPNPAAAAPSPAIFDEVAPSVSFNPGSPFLTNGPNVPVTIIFSEPVSGFGTSSLQVNGAAIASLQPVGDGMQFILSLTSPTDGPFTVTVPAGVASDAAGNVNAAATLNGLFDTTRPTAAVTRVSAPLIRTEPAVFRVQFSEAVAAFTPAMVSFGGSTVGGTLSATILPDAAPNAYFVRVSGMSGTGTIHITIPGGQITDLAGNAMLGDAQANEDIGFDNVAPTATLATVPAGITLARTEIPALLTMSEPVIGLTGASFIVNGPASITGFQPTGDGLSYSFTITATGDGPFNILLPAGAALDPAANPNFAAALDGTFDSTGPLGSATPSAGVFTDIPVTFNVAFTEALGTTPTLKASDVIIGGSARPSTVAVSNTGSQTFTVTVTGMIRTGTVTIQLPAGVVVDVAGNASTNSFGATANFVTTAIQPPALVGTREFGVGADAGGAPIVDFFSPDGTPLISTQVFDSSITGGVRLAAADFTRDGIADLIIGSGPGQPSIVRILNGANGNELLRINPFEASFLGGVFVAAGDFDGDGLADLVVTPDVGGGPRVQVYRVVDFLKLADFYGIQDPNFRGGARAATGDMNGDGRADLLVAAGMGGGPRVAVYDGISIGNRSPRKLINDIFVFEQTLRNGVYITAGDLNNDGYADLIVGGGPGGGPRVMALSGFDLVSRNGVRTVLSNFFAGDPNNRDGIRIAVKNLDNDGYADLLTGPGTGAGSTVYAYLGRNLAIGFNAFEFAFDAFGGATNGVFVG